jgi:hypothetical protein
VRMGDREARMSLWRDPPSQGQRRQELLRPVLAVGEEQVEQPVSSGSSVGVPGAARIW